MYNSNFIIMLILYRKSEHEWDGEWLKVQRNFYSPQNMKNCLVTPISQYLEKAVNFQKWMFVLKYIKNNFINTEVFIPSIAFYQIIFTHTFLLPWKWLNICLKEVRTFCLPWSPWAKCQFGNQPLGRLHIKVTS